VTVQIPEADVLGGVERLNLYGRICNDAAAVFDASTGWPGCAGGGAGTTAAFSIALQSTPGPDTNANHNPSGDRGFTLDGTDWPAAASSADDPCISGPRLTAGSGEHTIGTVTAGADRESYTRSMGDPPVPTGARESLQISHFATGGKLNVPFSFVEAAEAADETPVHVKWTAPKAGTIAQETPVAFTFVTRDSRGGTDWTTRAVCLTP